MKAIFSLTITFALVFFFALSARAQEVTRMPEDKQQSVGLETGLEAAFIARAAYGHRVNLGFVPDARIVVRFTLPIVAPDFGDWGIDGGLQATVLSSHDFRLALLAGPLVRNTVTNLFSATAFGLGATALVGYEGSRWGLSAEASYEQMLATHLRHSDVYRETYYADAKNGWYALSGSHARAGLRGGARFGRVEIAARAGLEATGHFQSTMPPFYFTLGGGYAF